MRSFDQFLAVLNEIPIHAWQKASSTSCPIFYYSHRVQVYFSYGMQSSNSSKSTATRPDGRPALPQRAGRRVRDEWTCCQPSHPLLRVMPQGR
jgi:hypothetical protein